MAGERTFVVKILGNADGAITAFKKLGREGSDALGDVFDVAKKGVLIASAAAAAVAPIAPRNLRRDIAAWSRSVMPSATDSWARILTGSRSFDIPKY